jgi:hypothetical protein
MPSFGNAVTTFPPNLHVQQLFVGRTQQNASETEDMPEKNK